MCTQETEQCPEIFGERLFNPKEISATNMTTIRHPKHIRAILEVFNEHFGSQRPTIGAEVGVFKGNTSATLCKTFPGLKMIMVDLWKEWPADSPYGSEHLDMGKLSQKEWDEIKAHAKKVMSGYSHVIIEKSSVDAANDISDGLLDFAYLDANHLYRDVQSDIEAWLPKIKTGGLLCGHDYGGYSDRIGRWGVKRAVDQKFGSKVIVPAGTSRVWAVKIGNK